eukprot:scaffold87504_cov18-Tisochrysis_lutea.AAC.5
MDVVLVSLMTPTAVLGGGSRAAMSTSWLQKQLAKVPSAVFEASVPVGPQRLQKSQQGSLSARYCGTSTPMQA